MSVHSTTELECIQKIFLIKCVGLNQGFSALALVTLYMCLGEVGLCIVNGQLLPWLVPSSCPLQPPLPSLQPVVTIKNVSEYFQMFPWYKATAG